MAETPKKFVESGSKCFTCSSLCTVNEKVFIFGKSAQIFAEIIPSMLNININCSDNSDLFISVICKRVCCKRLLRFQFGGLLIIYKKSKRKSRRPSEPERNRELNGCCDLKIESPTKPRFLSTLETLQRKLRNLALLHLYFSDSCLILTVSPCLLLLGLLCTFLVCYRQLEIIRIVSC